MIARAGKGHFYIECSVGCTCVVSVFVCVVLARLSRVFTLVVLLFLVFFFFLFFPFFYLAFWRSFAGCFFFFIASVFFSFQPFYAVISFFVVPPPRAVSKGVPRGTADARL